MKNIKDFVAIFAIGCGIITIIGVPVCAFAFVLLGFVSIESARMTLHWWHYLIIVLGCIEATLLIGALAKNDI